jgi:hypothetical protein
MQGWLFRDSSPPVRVGRSESAVDRPAQLIFANRIPSDHIVRVLRLNRSSSGPDFHPESFEG